jgi:hypothetical protein
MAFGADVYTMIVGDEGKLLEYDLQYMGEPKVLYEHHDEEATFTFDVINCYNYLVIFEESKFSILDMDKDNELVVEMSAEDLGLEEIYP